MRESILPHPQYTFMSWCSVKAQGQLYIFTFMEIRMEELN